MPKPTNAGYFQRYIDQVPEEDLLSAFTAQFTLITHFLSGITEEKSNHAYAEGKWSIKEVLQHIIDTERIFAYRALCFARKEAANLPGFEENDYAANSNAGARAWKNLVEEFLAVRHSTLLLFQSFSPDALETNGKANNNSVSVLAIGFTTLGHFYHHKKVIEERYL